MVVRSISFSVAPLWFGAVRPKVLNDLERQTNFGAHLARSKFALPRRTGKKEEALGLRRLLHSLIVASVAAVVALSANNAVRAFDDEMLDASQNTAGNVSILLAQNAGAGERQ